MMKASARLRTLVDSIAGGASVDWDTWERDSPEVEEQHLVQSFRRIAEVADAFRHLRRDEETPPPALPTRWGHLEILQPVGRGSFGDVFRARDPRVGRDVALKLLRRKDSRPPDGIIREAHLLAKVKHPNVATVYGADERDGRVGIWMEYLDGPTLATKLREAGPFPVLDAARIGADVCRALAAVHAVGLLHRDVKASNIVLQDNERAVLMDFSVGAERFQLAQSPFQEVCGTPLYLAPEALRGFPQTVASDIYSVGVLLFHLVTDDFPVVARDETSLEKAHRDGRRRLLSEASPELPKGFSRIVDRALAAAPPERFREAGEMAEALDAVVKGLERKRRRAGARKLVLAAIVFTAALAALFPLWSSFTEIPPGSQILLARIDNQTGDRALGALETLLETELQQSPHLQIVEEGRVRFALTQMVRSPSEARDLETSREVAWRLGAPLVLTAKLVPVGSSYTLALRMDRLRRDSPTPTASWLKEFRARGKEELFDAVDAAGRWVRETAGEQRAAMGELDLPVREMTTPSWEALEYFHQAEELKQRDRRDEAILLLQQAVEADPDFATAHMRLGDVLSSLTEADAYHHWEIALESMNRRPVSKREELNIRALYAIDTGDPRAAEPLYRTLSLLYPNDHRASYYHGVTLRVLARYPEALDRLLDAERRSPEPLYNVLVQIAATYLALEDREGVLAYVSRLRAIDRHGWADAFEGALQFIDGEHAEAERFFRGMTRDPETVLASRGYSLLAAALGELGRLDEAAGALREGIEQDAKWGRPSDRSGKLLDLAQVFLLQGKAQDARAACLEALALERGPHQVALAGTLLARGGFPEDARRLLPELAAERDKPLFERVALRVQGEILLVEGHTNLALEDLRRAAALDRPIEPKLYLARALRLAGNLEEAAASYGEIARSEGLIWMKRICERPHPPGFFAGALEEYAEIARSVRLDYQAEQARERLGELREERAR